MKLKHIILVLGGLLVLVGLLKPDFSKLIPTNNNSNNNDIVVIEAPSDSNIKKEAEDVVVLLKTFPSSKSDFKRLRDLYLDMGRLVELDGEDLVIKNTEDIRQANSLAGVMLKLDMKNKFPNLAKECKEVIVASIGDDNILLSKELRPKGVDGFNALAWAFNEGSK